GAGPAGGSSPTIALGWMLRSWFFAPAPSRPSVRMCHGAPDTWLAPSRTPPARAFQYDDWARWPPQASSTALPVDLNETRIATLLLPDAEPEWTGWLIEVIEPPHSVSRRCMPA